jgi:hypothetical protein
MRVRVRGEWFWVDSETAADAVKRIVEKLGIPAIVENQPDAA